MRYPDKLLELPQTAEDIQQGIRRVPVGLSGKCALVSPEDYPLVIQYSWSEIKGHRGQIYAMRTWRVRGVRHSQRMHNLIMDVDGKTSSVLVDHRNFDGLDNRRSNLRLADLAQSAAHRRVRPGKKTIGVYPRGDKWVVRCGGKYVGMFASELEAQLAYNSTALALYGTFATVVPTDGLT